MIFSYNQGPQWAFENVIKTLANVTAIDNVIFPTMKTGLTLVNFTRAKAVLRKNTNVYEMPGGGLEHPTSGQQSWLVTRRFGHCRTDQRRQPMVFPILMPLFPTWGGENVAPMVEAQAGVKQSSKPKERARKG